jgi:membrane protein YqaA with SNARE-associated domain
MRKKRELLKTVGVALALLLVVLVALKLLVLAFPGAAESVRGIAGKYGLFGTFLVVLLGSTLLPFSVDVYFIASLQVFNDPFALFVVAVVASIIGGFINYAMAFVLSEKWVEKQVGKEAVGQAREWFNQWGGIALLVFGVLPLSAVFDPLTFIAGMSRMDVAKFGAFLLVSRVAHFAVLAIAAKGLGI